MKKGGKDMAVQSILVNSAMNIRYKGGIAPDGSDLIKGKKYSNIKATAAAEDLLFIGTAIGNLMKYELVEVQRNDDSVLVTA
jgi:hypothetical protein